MHDNGGESQVLDGSVGAWTGDVKIADTPVLAMADFNAVDTCTGFFPKAWTHFNSRLTISPAGFHKDLQVCHSVVDLTLQSSTSKCSTAEWHYLLKKLFSINV